LHTHSRARAPARRALTIKSLLRETSRTLASGTRIRESLQAHGGVDTRGLDVVYSKALYRTVVSVLTVTNVKTNTDTQKLEHIPTRMLKAELERRDNGRTYADVYERCGVSDEHKDLFDEVVYAICTEGKTITEVSTPTRAGFIHGNAKNWVRNAGNLRGFRELCGSHTPTDSTTFEAQPMSVPENVCRTYLESRRKAGNGFTTTMTMVETGTYKGNPFGIVQNTNSKRWVIGQVTKLDKVVAIPMTRGAYKNVDKETKGQRMVCEIPVFDPQG